MVSGRTVIHAVAGAVVSVVFSFVPFSTAIGGALAGFLEGPDGRDGAYVGAFSGAITMIPFLVGAVFVLGFLGVGFGVAAVPFEGLAFVIAFAALALAVIALFTVAPAVLGGYVGAYLAREHPEKRDDLRETIGLRTDEPIDRRRRESRGPGEHRDPQDRYESREWRDPSRSTVEDDGWASADESVPPADRTPTSRRDEGSSSRDEDDRDRERTD